LLIRTVYKRLKGYFHAGTRSIMKPDGTMSMYTPRRSVLRLQIILQLSGLLGAKLPRKYSISESPWRYTHFNADR